MIKNLILFSFCLLSCSRVNSEKTIEATIESSMGEVQLSFINKSNIPYYFFNSNLSICDSSFSPNPCLQIEPIEIVGNSNMTLINSLEELYFRQLKQKGVSYDILKNEVDLLKRVRYIFIQPNSEVRIKFKVLNSRKPATYQAEYNSLNISTLEIINQIYEKGEIFNFYPYFNQITVNKIINI